LAERSERPRGVVDTSVVVAGVAAFKECPPASPSAKFLREWLDHGSFTWLVTEEILAEYKAVLSRLRVRRSVVGALINLLREEAAMVEAGSGSGISPDPGDDPLCACAEEGDAAFIVTLNPRDFPQRKLRAKVISPGDPMPTTARRRARPVDTRVRFRKTSG
jgi:predicted nucleic acid-binding protein